MVQILLYKLPATGVGWSTLVSISQNLKKERQIINLTLPSKCSLLIPLKPSEDLWFSDVLRGDQKGILGRKGLNEMMEGEV